MTTLPRLAEQLVAHRSTLVVQQQGPCRGGVAPPTGHLARAFASVKDHPATVRALARAHRELRDLTTAGLDGARTAGPLPPTSCACTRRSTQDLDERWYDAIALLHAAADLCETDPEAVTASGHVVLYLPQALTAAETRSHGRWRRRPPATTIAVSPAYAVPTTPSGARWRPQARVADTHVQPPVGQRVLHASDADDEVRCTVRQVRLGATAASRPPGRGPVRVGRALRPSPSRAPGRGRHHTVNGPSTRAVHERALPRGFLGVLGWRLWTSHAVRPSPRWLRHPCVIATVSASRSHLERTSRTAAVVGGEDWVPRLERHLERERARLLREQQAESIRGQDRCRRARDRHHRVAARLRHRAAAAPARGRSAARCGRHSQLGS